MALSRPGTPWRHMPSVRVPPPAHDGRRPHHVLLPALPGPRPRTMGRVTGTRRAVVTAALFSVALPLLVVAIISHSAIPLFVMWVPLLAVPLVLGRADRDTRPVEAEDGSTVDAGDQGSRNGPGERD